MESPLYNLYNMNRQNKEDIIKLESELKNIREEKDKGRRTKAKYDVEGERRNQYSCNLEERHYTAKIIPNFILDDNTEKTNQKLI